MMNSPYQLSDVLDKFVQRMAYTPGQLAQLSGIPQATIVNWLEGRVKKPRQWHGLLKLATVLHLDEQEASLLLSAAGYPALDVLVSGIQDKQDRKLFTPWLRSIHQQQKMPFQLIADLPYFVGRHTELLLLRDVLLNGQVVLCSLEGMGGVGKTSLAVRLGYMLRTHFPDGVLWARPDHSDPMSILNHIAMTYDQDVHHLTDMASRSLAVREILASKRALLILDNVEHSQQIRPLLPPNGNCVVVMTTRRRNLAIARGAYRLRLGPFDKGKKEALTLFTHHLGVSCVREEEAWLKQIADMLGHLPLAVDIVASRLAYEPNWQAADFQKRLQQMERRLGELTYDDQSVRSSFDFSYQALTAELRQLFAVLALFGGQDFGVEAVASIMEVEADTVHDQLRQIYGLSLLRQSQPDRYCLHPLLRDYAYEQLPSNSEVVRKMVTYFVLIIEEHISDYEVLDTEFSNILAAFETAAHHKMTALHARGVCAFFNYLNVRGFYTLAEKLLSQAQQLAQESGHHDEIGQILLYRGKVARSAGDAAQAETYLSQGLQIISPQENPYLYSALLSDLGLIKGTLGKFDEADDLLQKSLQLAHGMEDNHKKLSLLTARGIGALNRFCFDQAQTYFQEGLSLAREMNHREREGAFLLNLGAVAIEKGHVEAAEKHYLDALSIGRQIGYPVGICIALNNLSDLEIKKAEYEQAIEYIKEGLELAHKLDNSYIIFLLLRHYGIAEGKMGNYEQAHTYLQESLSLTAQLGQWHQTASLHHHLAELSEAIQAEKAARDYFQQGMALARKHNHPLVLYDLLIKWGAFCFRHDDIAAAQLAHKDLLSLIKKVDNVDLRQKLQAEVREHLGELLSR